MNWQPIETVPDEGFFLVHEDGAIRAMLREGRKWVHPGLPVLITEHGDRLVSTEVERAYGRRLEISDCVREPTHWMPLPEPPSNP
jgi:hypothetical protein